ncbi:MAG TPA: hypothetical protein VH678_29175 [Xanthobacteraceae bacterium]|jgi:hypothetical protein
MSYAANNRGLVTCFVENASARSGIAKRPGVLRRVLDLLFESRQKQADRDIARFLSRSGGRLTDEMERELTQRLFRGNWNPR